MQQDERDQRSLHRRDQGLEEARRRGQGHVVADVDTGIDYTHKNFGGRGTLNAYNQNDPNVIEPGSFPTNKVIGGYDFVGPDYAVTDEDPTNDIPRPDPDPLDAVEGDHGSHTAGSCCGNGVTGEIGAGVAPKSKLLAIKVWDRVTRPPTCSSPASSAPSTRTATATPTTLPMSSPSPAASTTAR